MSPSPFGIRVNLLLFVALTSTTLVTCFKPSPTVAQESVPVDPTQLGLEIPEIAPGIAADPVPAFNPLLFPPEGVVVPQVEVTRSPFDVAMESIFGPADSSTWRPLPLRTFFSEGWNEPFVYPVRSESGAPRQGWINAFDGVMYRLWFNAAGFRQNVGKNGYSYYSDWTVFIPLNRRLDIRIDVPYVNGNKAGPENKYVTQFGDMNLLARLLLFENQNTTVIAVTGTSVPTGQPATGGGATQLGNGIQFWHSPGNKWVVRGGLNFVVPATNRPDGIRTNGNVNLAIGKYITEPGTPLIGDLVLYTSTNMITSLDNRGPNNTFFALTPGYRAEITKNWYHLAGVEVPVVGGPSNYTYGLQFWLLKVY